MDEINIDKTSNLVIGLASPDTKTGFGAFRKGHFLLLFVLLIVGFSSIQFFKPSSAPATLAVLSKMIFQKSGFSDQEILDRSASGLTLQVTTSAGAHASGIDATLDQGSPLFDGPRILTDYKGRISEAFHVPPGLSARVQFWFDIYTKYGLDERVIHSQKFPWLILKVVDVAPILYAETPSLRWLRNQRAETVVQDELRSVKRRILKIAKTKNLETLTGDDLSIVATLRTLPGKIQKNALLIANSLRVQTGQKEVFQEGLSLSRQFLPQMEAIFQEQKLPTELTRIPLVESSFNHLATSKAGASGVWQFIGNTGKKFLLVNSSIDERRSPIKSTYAAALLLKEDYMLLKHHWPLAITAYNHGPGGVRRAAKTAKSYDLAVILTRYQSRSFSFASGNYYTEFLAALYAEKYQDEIFGSVESDIAKHTQIVRLSRKMSAHDLLNKIDMPSEDFIDLNPELKKAVERNSALPKGFKIHIPLDKKAFDPKIFVEKV